MFNLLEEIGTDKSWVLIDLASEDLVARYVCYYRNMWVLGKEQEP